LRRFFRNVSTANTPGKPNDGQKTAARRVEITVEREIITVLHPSGVGSEHSCPLCGQATPALQPDCFTHQNDDLILDPTDSSSNPLMLRNSTDEVK